MITRHDLGLVLKILLNLQGRRREARRECFFRIARRFTPSVAATTADGIVYVDTRDRAVGLDLFARGGMDDEVLTSVVGFLGELGVPVHGRTLLEIGANIGSTTIPALRRHGFGRVVAVEPSPENILRLRTNLAANGLEARVDVLESALSDVEGTMALALAPGNSGDNRLVNRVAVADAGAFGEEARRTTDVRVHRLDALVDDGRILLDNVALVWMDVQGHEAHVLAGASVLASREIPVLLEYWPYGLARSGGLERLHELIAERYAVAIDMHSWDRHLQPELVQPGALPQLKNAYARPEQQTDLLLVPASLSRAALALAAPGRRGAPAG